MGVFGMLRSTSVLPGDSSQGPCQPEAPPPGSEADFRGAERTYAAAQKLARQLSFNPIRPVEKTGEINAIKNLLNRFSPCSILCSAA